MHRKIFPILHSFVNRHNLKLPGLSCMPKKSAGILFYRVHNHLKQVLLVHPGGPFWAKKDAGAWSIPKGEIEADEEPLTAAIREVAEETGVVAKGNFIELVPAKQKSGKLVFAWALLHDFDETNIKSNEFEMEWPPKSGNKKSFPEIDKAGWFSLQIAKEKIVSGQVAFLEELEKLDV